MARLLLFLLCLALNSWLNLLLAAEFRIVLVEPEQLQAKSAIKTKLKQTSYTNYQQLLVYFKQNLPKLLPEDTNISLYGLDEKNSYEVISSTPLSSSWDKVLKSYTINKKSATNSGLNALLEDLDQHWPNTDKNRHVLLILPKHWSKYISLGSESLCLSAQNRGSGADRFHASSSNYLEAEARAYFLDSIVTDLRYNKVRLHILLYEDPADYEFLQQATNQTKGLFARINNQQDLQLAMNKISSLVVPKTRQVLPEYKFKIEQDLTDLVVVASKAPSLAHPGKPNKLVFGTPNEKLFMRNAHPSNVYWQEGQIYSLVRVRRPQLGNWSIYGYDEHDERIEIYRHLHLELNLPAGSGRLLDPIQVFAGEKLSLLLQLSHAADAKAVQSYKNKSSQPVELDYILNNMVVKVYINSPDYKQKANFSYELFKASDKQFVLNIEPKILYHNYPQSRTVNLKFIAKHPAFTRELAADLRVYPFPLVVETEVRNFVELAKIVAPPFLQADLEAEQAEAKDKKSKKDEVKKSDEQQDQAAKPSQANAEATKPPLKLPDLKLPAMQFVIKAIPNLKMLVAEKLQITAKINGVCKPKFRSKCPFTTELQQEPKLLSAGYLELPLEIDIIEGETVVHYFELSFIINGFDNDGRKLELNSEKFIISPPNLPIRTPNNEPTPLPATKQNTALSKVKK